MSESTIWLIAMMFAAAGTVYANNKFNSARGQETKNEIAKKAFELVLPEIRFNMTLFPNFRLALKQNEVPMQHFASTAWDTVSASGQLSSLDQRKIVLLTQAYYYVRHCNEFQDMLSRYSIGIESSLPHSKEMGVLYNANLTRGLDELELLLADLLVLVK